MEIQKFKIKLPEGYTYEQLLLERKLGGKFIFYVYIISRPIIPPIKRISKIFYLRPGESPKKYAKKYNSMNLLFGWWGLPHGPSHTYSAIVNNNKGYDLTDDVYDNITEESFLQRQVAIERVSSIFIYPAKSEYKDLLKQFKKFDKKGFGFTSNPIIGYYIDTEDPFYVIGLSEKDLCQIDLIRKEVYKVFYKHVRFEFISLDEASELSSKLRSQGKEMEIRIM